mmetsp:Transcript_20509/g.78602  ORF Transcript_20509/g.78602 Transcript_20509/m.78602 type:complete len:419 (-) Transcript_20509:825-2081(-)
MPRGTKRTASALASIDCQERDEDKRILLHTMRKDELQGRKRKKVEHEEKSKRAQELSVLAEEGYLPRKDESLVPQFSQTASPGLSKSLRVAKPIEELFQRFLPPEFYEELRQCLQEVQDLHPGERHTPITLPVVQQYVAAEVELMAQNPTAMVHYFKAKEEQGIKGFGRSTFMRVRGLFQHLTTRDQTRLRDAARAATAGLVEIGDRVSFDERLKRFNPRASDTDSVVRTIRDKPTGRGLLVYSANVLLLPPMKASDHQKQTRETYPMIIWYNQVLLRDQRAPADSSGEQPRSSRRTSSWQDRCSSRTRRSHPTEADDFCGQTTHCMCAASRGTTLVARPHSLRPPCAWDSIACGRQSMARSSLPRSRSPATPAKMSLNSRSPTRIASLTWPSALAAPSLSAWWSASTRCAPSSSFNS